MKTISNATFATRLTDTYEGTLKTHIVVKHCKSNSYNHNENINGDNVVKADEDNKEGVKDEKSSVENEKCVKGFENL